MAEVTDRLLQEAQSIMDAYYQDFAPDDAFFRIEDFAKWLGYAYGKFADQVAKEIYQTSRGETGVGQITFSQDWWAKKTVEVEKKEGVLTAQAKIKTIGFTYDNQNSSIQEVIGVGGKGNCGTFIRTSLTDLWTLANMSKNSIVYWYPDIAERCDDGIPIIFKVNGECLPKTVAVYYIPAVDDENFKLPSSKAFEIATLAYNFMLSAKKETPFVDSTNNSNKNITPQTEVDTKQVKPVGS